ncbi:DUF4396 domain-containing protein [Geodermatophilus sp. SYSU D00779]
MEEERHYHPTGHGHVSDQRHGRGPGHAGRRRELDRVAVTATVHCLTGCAIGEVRGMVIARSLGWSDFATIVPAIALAFVFGYSFTIVPVL